MPTAEETAAREEVRNRSGYEMLPLATDPGHGGAPTTYMPVVCSLCGTRMYGTAEQVGPGIGLPRLRHAHRRPAAGCRIAGAGTVPRFAGPARNTASWKG